MSEGMKTCLFVGVACLALVAAILSRPTPPPSNTDGLVSMKNLNPLDDPLSAQELEIIRWDPAIGDKIDFKVAREDGVWKIPSHNDYPADAERQMGDAATAATNLKPLGIVTTKAADHELYGVIDPGSDKSGTSGVGTRVVMKDAKGETLVSTIIGKEVKGESGQRYVRQIGKDPVYIVKVDPSKLSTKFEDWIEKDLLKINTMDLAKVRINDYSVKTVPTPEGLQLLDDRKGEIVLAFDNSKNTWSIDKLLQWNPEARAMVPEQVPEGEELNNTKLNAMKDALSELKIIDVQHKPEGMTPDLKLPGDRVSTAQQMQDLMRRGFYAVSIENGSMELLASEGDFIVEQKDGVEYVLRFGGIKVGGSGSNAGEGESPEGEKKAEEKGENRYLFVAARFNPNMIEKPVRPEILGPEPSAEEPGAETPAENTEGEKTEAAPAEGEAAPKKEEAAPAAEKTPAEKAPAKEEPAAEPKADESAALTLDQQDGGAVDQPAPTPAAKKDAEAKKSAEPATEKKEAEPAAEEKAPAAEEEKKEPAADPEAKEPAKDAPAKEDAAKDAPKVSPDDEAAKREAAELQYNRAMDEYNDKIQKGQDRVTELNNRFGDWYYVISDEVFKKIHITRQDLFAPKKDEKKADEAAPKSSIPLEAPESIKEE